MKPTDSFFDEIVKLSKKTIATNEMGIGIEGGPVSHEVEYDDGTEKRKKGWIKTKGPHDYYIRVQPGGKKVYRVGTEKGKRKGVRLSTKEKPYKKVKIVLGRGETVEQDRE